MLTGKAAPAALVQAQQRVQARASTQVQVGSPTDEERSPIRKFDKGTTAGAAGYDWFMANYCTATDRFQMFPFYSAVSFWDRSGLGYMRSGALAIAGSIHYDASYVPNGIFVHYSRLEADLPQGYYAVLWASSSRNAAGMSQVIPSGGTYYLHCINYHY